MKYLALQIFLKTKRVCEDKIHYKYRIKTTLQLLKQLTPGTISGVFSISFVIKRPLKSGRLLFSPQVFSQPPQLHYHLP